MDPRVEAGTKCCTDKRPGTEHISQPVLADLRVCWKRVGGRRSRSGLISIRVHVSILVYGAVSVRASAPLGLGSASGGLSSVTAPALPEPPGRVKSVEVTGHGSTPFCAAGGSGLTFWAN